MKKQSHTVRVLNTSGQMIPLQVKPPQGDFFLHEQQVRLRPGEWAELPKDFLRLEQVKNLQAKRMLVVVSDTEAAEEREAAAIG